MSQKKTPSTKKPAADAKPTVPMISGQGAAQKIAKETARIAAKAIARVENADVVKVGKTKPKAKSPKKAGMSGLDAAAKVLADAGKPLTTLAIAEAAIKRGLWTTNGKTPHATLYSAVIREIAKKGSASRFRKTDRGHFTVAKGVK